MKSKGKIGGMVLKIDLEKAYDRISWNFLKKVLHNFNFSEKTINLIMSCMNNGETTILWNGEKTEAFTPGRGLRQGDPLSPVNTKDWEGLKASPNGPVFSHLFFADDLILFAKANDRSAMLSWKPSMSFAKCRDKKSISKNQNYFAPNVPIREALKISFRCGMQLTKDLGTYLGVPIVHGRFNHAHCNHIVEKVQKRLAGWKANCISLAGRRTLVQAVTSTIPNYAMQTMSLPIKLCDKIDKLNRDFLWGDSDNKKKIHLVKWRNVCKPKKHGGYIYG